MREQQYTYPKNGVIIILIHDYPTVDALASRQRVDGIF